jgi:hypothetical protein
MAKPIIQSLDFKQSDMVLSANTNPGAMAGTDSRSVIGSPIWASGQVVQLTERGAIDHKWCTDCWVNILLSSSQEGRYSIIAKANIGDSQRIYPD